jgi:hypothetical protein
MHLYLLDYISSPISVDFICPQSINVSLRLIGIQCYVIERFFSSSMVVARNLGMVAVERSGLAEGHKPSVRNAKFL